MIELKADPNFSFAEGYTPLQVAVIQENTSLVKYLLQLPNIKKQGALTLAKGEIELLLTDTLDVTDEKAIQEIWHSYWNSIDEFTDVDGNTILIRAILEGDVNISKTCMQLGANRKRMNQYGMSATDYAVWIGQPRLTDIVGTDCVVRNQIRGVERQLVFLVPRKFVALQDYFIQRMLQIKELKIEENFHDILEQKLDTTTILEIKNLPILSNPDVGFRVTYATIGPDQSNIIQKFIIQLYLLTEGSGVIPDTYLRAAFYSLPVFTEEVFILFPRRVEKDELLSVQYCFSGSSLWKLASRSDLPEKQQLLDVAIFKTKNARFLGSRHSEVVLLPGTYRCKERYHYSPICLGQRGIRARTFKIKEGDVLKRLVLEFEDV